MFYHENPRVFTKQEIEENSSEYRYKPEPKIEKKGYLTVEDFIKIALWKSTRPKRHYERNSEEFIKEVTSIAFSKNTSEEMRIQVLGLLNGVQFPVASAILHLGYDSTYPIIDFRTLWSLWGIPEKEIRYSSELWICYLSICRKMARDHKVSERKIDKALWQFSKLGQLAI